MSPFAKRLHVCISLVQTLVPRHVRRGLPCSMILGAAHLAILHPALRTWLRCFYKGYTTIIRRPVTLKSVYGPRHLPVLISPSRLFAYSDCSKGRAFMGPGSAAALFLGCDSVFSFRWFRSCCHGVPRNTMLQHCASSVLVFGFGRSCPAIVRGPCV
ncbi:hypothetical protein EDD85DRAFT_830375 [Armillaria nabsnona]|nr:hypothetical protein EDD85DRAFT_830375 [Armillaria nabsnona]